MGRAFGKVGPAKGGRFFAWVLDGASPDERAAVPHEVPGPVLVHHRRGLRPRLSQERRAGLEALAG